MITPATPTRVPARRSAVHRCRWCSPDHRPDRPATTATAGRAPADRIDAAITGIPTLTVTTQENR